MIFFFQNILQVAAIENLPVSPTKSPMFQPPSSKTPLRTNQIDLGSPSQFATLKSPKLPSFNEVLSSKQKSFLQHQNNNTIHYPQAETNQHIYAKHPMDCSTPEDEPPPPTYSIPTPVVEKHIDLNVSAVASEPLFNETLFDRYISKNPNLSFKVDSDDIMNMDIIFDNVPIEEDTSIVSNVTHPNGSKILSTADNAIYIVQDVSTPNGVNGYEPVATAPQIEVEVEAEGQTNVKHSVVNGYVPAGSNVLITVEGKIQSEGEVAENGPTGVANTHVSKEPQDTAHVLNSDNLITNHDKSLGEIIITPVVESASTILDTTCKTEPLREANVKTGPETVAASKIVPKKTEANTSTSEEPSEQNKGIKRRRKPLPVLVGRGNKDRPKEVKEAPQTTPVPLEELPQTDASLAKSAFSGLPLVEPSTSDPPHSDNSHQIKEAADLPLDPKIESQSNQTEPLDLHTGTTNAEDKVSDPYERTIQGGDADDIPDFSGIGSEDLLSVEPNPVLCQESQEFSESEPAAAENDLMNSLVVVESQDPNDPDRVIHEVYVMCPLTKQLSEHPLDLPDEVVQRIRSAIQ